jgi:hypothetical protein
MSHPLELQVEVIDAELIRVSITRENRTVSTFVTSHHLVEDKRRQLLAHFQTGDLHPLSHLH